MKVLKFNEHFGEDHPGNENFESGHTLDNFYDACKNSRATNVDYIDDGFTFQLDGEYISLYWDRGSECFVIDNEQDVPREISYEEFLGIID